MTGARAGGGGRGDAVRRCVLELYIFNQMGGSLEQIVFVHVGTHAGVGSDASTTHQRALPANGRTCVDAFDVRHVVTTDPLDQMRLLAVIEGGGGGIAAFNEWVRMTLMPAAARQLDGRISAPDRAQRDGRVAPVAPGRAPAQATPRPWYASSATSQK